METLKKISLIIIGILLSLVFLEIGLQTVSYANKIVKNHNIKKQLKNKNTITILCLGESTTDGQWPPILQKILDKKAKDKKFNVIDEGHEASRTNYLMQEVIYKKLKIYNPDIIISMMGINDEDKTVKNLRKFRLKTISLIYLIIENIKKLSIVNKLSVQELNNQKDFNYYFKQAISAYHNKEYDKAVEIYKYLSKNFPQEKEKFIIDEILAYKFAQKPLKELEHVIFDLIKINPYIAIHEVLEFLCKTENIDLLKKIFLDDVNIDKNIRKNIDRFIFFRNDIEKIGLKELALKIDKQIQYLSNINNKKKVSFRRIKLYGYLATQNLINNNYNEYKKYFDIQTNFFVFNTPQITMNNYKNLAKICKQNHIKLIAMQYPLRSLKPLKQMLAEFDEIIFINNEEIFKQALQKYNLEEIFRDRFAGDFGHCTELGNTLIAENVAETILKLYNQ